MPVEVRAFQCLIPAKTAKATPVVVSLAMPARIVRTIEITVPRGPSGLVGFALGSAGQNVIPYNNGAWIVTDDEKITWDVDEQIDSGAWQLQGYNTGQYDHTVYLRFLLDLVQVAQTAPVLTLVSNDELSA